MLTALAWLPVPLLVVVASTGQLGHLLVIFVAFLVVAALHARVLAQAFALPTAHDRVLALSLGSRMTAEEGGSRVSTHRNAGLLERVAAFAIDYLPILAYLALVVAVGAVVGWAFPEALARPFAHPASAQAAGFVLVTLPVVLYFALSEASVHRATLGKRRRGLLVVGVDGGRLGLARSSLRTCLKFVPWELAHTVVWGMSLSGGDPARTHLALLALVWAMVWVNAVGILVWQRAPYDVVAGARVVRSSRRARAR